MDNNSPPDWIIDDSTTEIIWCYRTKKPRLLGQVVISPDEQVRRLEVVEYYDQLAEGDLAEIERSFKLAVENYLWDR